MDIFFHILALVRRYRTTVAEFFSRCYSGKVMAIITTAEGMNTPLSVDPEIEAMLDAGVHLGHIRSKRHSGMTPYLWGMRNNVEIIDLAKTKEKLHEAMAFLRQVAVEKKLILFVGTRPSAKDLIQRTAEELGYPHVNRRWIGGTLTNFKVIFKRIETLEGLEQEKAGGGFEKYPKKERVRREDDIVRLRENFDGLRRLRKIPDAVVIIDISHDAVALREARRVKVPIIALTDTNTDPRLVDYPIPANDDAQPAVAYLLGRLKSAVLEGREAAEAVPVAASSAPDNEKAPENA